MKQKSILYALASVLLWSTVATVFKLALKDLSPFQFIWIASITSTIALFVILLFQGKLRQLKEIKSKTLLHASLLGLLNPTSYYLILFKAYQLLPAQIAQPLNMVWPLILSLLSVPILKHKLTPRNIPALIVSFIGVILIASQGNFSGFGDLQPSFVFGVLLALSSSLFWALFWIYSIKVKTDESIKLFISFMFSTIILSISGIVLDIPFPLIKHSWAGIYTGLFEMGITFFLWMKAMQFSKNNAIIANLVYLTPFLSLIWIYFILGEHILPTTYLGLVVIVIGIFINNPPKA
ncbi:DMT family transporter [Puteibacter caeruleilacunae]|nr:DMT family transporter [Puteibacter caeruleilacunae]